MRILYIPGFGGDENSRTFQVLKSELSDEVFCLSYDNFEFHKAKALLKNQVEYHLSRDGELRIVGNSLGGYWANMMSRIYGISTILINPGTNPRHSLAKYEGFSSDHLAAFEDFEPSKSIDYLFLGKHDDVVDPQFTFNLMHELTNVIWLEENHRIQDFSPIFEKVKISINCVSQGLYWD